MKFKSVTQFFPSFFLTTVIIICWQLAVVLGLVNIHVLPAPSSIVFAFVKNFSIISIHTLQTLEETIIGLLLAILFGVSTAILLDSSSLIRKALYPLLVTSQTVPMIALAPLLLLWFGFGMLPKVIIVVLSCFFPIAIASVSGFAQIDSDLLRLLKSMNATRTQILLKVKLPGALPQFFAGLKIAATYSVTGAIVGEYVGAYQGLGIYMQQMAHSYAIDLVFAIIAVTALLSMLLFGIVVIVERISIPWHQKD